MNPLKQIFFLIITISTIQSCSIFHARSVQHATQPGEKITIEIATKNLDSVKEISHRLRGIDFLSKSNNAFITDHIEDVSELALRIERLDDVNFALEILAEQFPKKNNIWVASTLILYPLDKYQILEELTLSSQYTDENIQTAVLLAGLDPTDIFPSTSSFDIEYRIEPLINSASVTIYNQTKDIENELFFKKTNDDDWLPAYNLLWDPIASALSGSIVRLEPYTNYDVKVIFKENGNPFDEVQYQFTTRANTPPINPDLVFYLSDIYVDGVLDIEMLNIEGDEGGWAKIIGDGVVINAGVTEKAAINIGSKKYIMFENIIVRGGKNFGIYASKSDHLWIKGCDISEYGRTATYFVDGKGYETPESSKPINYDSGIYLSQSGVVVIEDCVIHSPNSKANNWGSGHPNGPNAILVNAKHPNTEFQGQYIIRNNRLFGTAEHRFNDVIESRANGRRHGGFIRDSAIHDNYIAYANDDLVELDGGQSNVLFYNNELEQGYCGISVVPNMQGPSYLFNNYIHNLGDDRGSSWAAIKMGGLMTAPSGITNIFENKILAKANGLAIANFKGDNTYWVNAINNFIVTSWYRENKFGLGINDEKKYEESSFLNNIIYNTKIDGPYLNIEKDNLALSPLSYNSDYVESQINSGANTIVALNAKHSIYNFSSSSSTSYITYQNSFIQFDRDEALSYLNQNQSNDFSINVERNAVTVRKNSWVSFPVTHTISKETQLSFDISFKGKIEIVGIAVNTDDTSKNNIVFNLFGSQKWGNRHFHKQNDYYNNLKTIIPLGDYLSGNVTKITYILDNDMRIDDDAFVTFSNVKLIEPNLENVNGEELDIIIGLVEE